MQIGCGCSVIYKMAEMYFKCVIIHSSGTDGSFSEGNCLWICSVCWETSCTITDCKWGCILRWTGECFCSLSLWVLYSSMYVICEEKSKSKGILCFLIPHKAHNNHYTVILLSNPLTSIYVTLVHKLSHATCKECCWLHVVLCIHHIPDPFICKLTLT